jgi:hypothetical protein
MECFPTPMRTIDKRNSLICIVICASMILAAIVKSNYMHGLSPGQSAEFSQFVSG